LLDAGAMSRPNPIDPTAARETVTTTSRRVACDGAGDIRPGAGYRPAALGHPRVWLEIDERGYADCGYCDKRFVLVGDAAAVRSSASPVINPIGEQPAA